MRHLNLFESVEQIAQLGSIRAAADAMSITSTALNRQILALEQELGQPIFERLPRGVRLNIAGEMFLIHARQQMRDFERMKIQLADLSGVRRGHVTVRTRGAGSKPREPRCPVHRRPPWSRSHAPGRARPAVRKRPPPARAELGFSPAP